MLEIAARLRPDCAARRAVQFVQVANDSLEKPARRHKCRTRPPQTVPSVPHVGDAYSVTGGGGPGRFRLPPGCRPGRPYRSCTLPTSWVNAKPQTRDNVSLQTKISRVSRGK